jgi:hypothetical protein
MECDGECDRAEAVWQDYLARVRAFTASCQCSLDFDQVLEGCQFFLSMQEMDLEQWEEKLAEEQTQRLYYFDGRDLLMELEERRGHVAGIESERAIEDVQLSWSIMEISDVLVDVGVFPIGDIPAHPESAQDILTVVNLILERLREEHAFGANP